MNAKIERQRPMKREERRGPARKMRVLGVIGAGVLAAAVAAKADVPSAAGAAKTFWFMPGAKDGDGSERSPFGSLDAVKSAVRAAVKDASLPDGAVHVVVPEGEYFLPSSGDI